jgi:HEAT repeats
MTRIDLCPYGARTLMLCVLSSLVVHADAVLSRVTTAADVIVVGTVTTRTESDAAVSFDINVERVLKGTPLAGSVHVSHPWTRIGVHAGPSVLTIDFQLHGIWFLQGPGSAGRDVIPVDRDGMIGGLFWPVASQLPASYHYGAGTALLDALVFEIAGGVQSTAGARPESLLRATGSLNTAAVQTALANFATDPRPPFQAVAVAGMLGLSQPASVSKLIQLWPIINNTDYRTYVVSALRDSFRDPTPASVRELASLAGTTTSPDLRQAAIRSLSAMHTRESLSFIVTLLSSSDADERVRGLFGISSFANGCPMQATDNVASMAYLQCDQPSSYRTPDTIANFAFRPGPADEQSRLLTFWLAWWNKRTELHQ